MSVELVGNLILLCGIAASGILFVVVNINYLPEDEDKDNEAR